MSWQSTMAWSTAQHRSAILTKIRRFFEERKVTEVETPLMCQGTITDLHLDALSTRYDFLIDGSKTFYFQTSPEYAMKRLLASGYGCIYQICKAFRHEAHGRYHNAEFTMLEWYRLGFDQFQLIDEVADLLKEILPINKTQKFSYQEVFKQFVKINPLNTSIGECLGFISSKDKNEPWLEESEDLDTLLQFIFSEFIEPKVGLDVPCFVYDFPASQASLAKISMLDERVAERFECYFKGVELVNGFNELTDAAIQHSRFEVENKERSSRGLPQRDIDHRLISALEAGLPDCSGVALGIDRLVMLALESKHINDVITFPVDKA